MLLGATWYPCFGLGRQICDLLTVTDETDLLLPGIAGILSNHPAEAGTSTAGCLGLNPDGFWLPSRTESAVLQGLSALKHEHPGGPLGTRDLHCGYRQKCNILTMICCT